MWVLVRATDRAPEAVDEGPGELGRHAVDAAGGELESTAGGGLGLVDRALGGIHGALRGGARRGQLPRVGDRGGQRPGSLAQVGKPGLSIPGGPVPVGEYVDPDRQGRGFGGQFRALRGGGGDRGDQCGEVTLIIGLPLGVGDEAAEMPGAIADRRGGGPGRTADDEVRR